MSDGCERGERWANEDSPGTREDFVGARLESAQLQAEHHGGVEERSLSGQEQAQLPSFRVSSMTLKALQLILM